MRHIGTQEIETPRLLLRRLLPEDAPAMYRNWAGDPAVTRFLRWEPHQSPVETLELLRAWAALYPNPDYYQWAIVEKAGGEAIGSMSIFNSLVDEPQSAGEWQGLDTAGGVWTPGYCLGRRWWGRGYMTEALCATVDYWFTRTDGGWMGCDYAAANLASGRVMEKAGFRYHHSATYHKFDGTPVRCRVCLLTREGYEANKRKEKL